MPVRTSATKSNGTRNLINAYDSVKKIFIKPSKPIISIEEKDSEQQGQGVKILTPKQLISRLPILLAQLKAGNNSEKLKNEIRQIA